MSTSNIHVVITDPGGKQIGLVDTTGAVFQHPSATVSATIAKSATGVVTSVRGVVPGTSVIFESQPSK
jgi:hypothetical protein